MERAIRCTDRYNIYDRMQPQLKPWSIRYSILMYKPTSALIFVHLQRTTIEVLFLCHIFSNISIHHSVIL